MTPTAIPRIPCYLRNTQNQPISKVFLKLANVGSVFESCPSRWFCEVIILAANQKSTDLCRLRPLLFLLLLFHCTLVCDFSTSSETLLDENRAGEEKACEACHYIMDALCHDLQSMQV